MSKMDFKIENGVLKKYNGYDSDVVIPDGVTEIGNWAFFQKSLQHVTIPNTVVVIGEHAFSSCQYLKAVEIPDSVLYIDCFAFYQCHQLQTVTMGEHVRTIGACAFKDCRALQTVRISEDILDIGREAFHDCLALQAFSFGGKFAVIEDCFQAYREDHVPWYLAHLVLNHPFDFDLCDLFYVWKHVFQRSNFLKEISYNELLTIENYLLSKENALDVLDAIRESGNVEYTAEMIRYLNENHIFSDYMEQFHLEL